MFCYIATATKKRKRVHSELYSFTKFYASDSPAETSIRNTDNIAAAFLAAFCVFFESFTFIRSRISSCEKLQKM